MKILPVCIKPVYIQMMILLRKQKTIQSLILKIDKILGSLIFFVRMDKNNKVTVFFLTPGGQNRINYV